MDESLSQFRLSTTLVGHEKDVRCLAALEGGGLVSGSRDFTARIWQSDGSAKDYRESMLIKSHSNFVSCVCILPPDVEYPKGLILTGSNDKSIHAFDVGSSEPVFKLQEHTDNVSVLTAGKFGTFVSGSWDCSAKVWMKNQCIMTLKGHEAAVWCVGILHSVGYILTGSADKSIKLWKGGSIEGTITGHTDCVRSLQVLVDNTFLSASNDATICHWNLQGECLNLINAHQSYIYTLALLNSQCVEILSAGEDACVKIWRDSICVQTIPLPAQSVWALCVLDNGDIATATNDGMIRIFTRSDERVASPEELDVYNEMLSKSSIPAQVGDIKTEDLPGPGALLTPGKSEGQVMMIRGNTAIEAYQWSSHNKEWIKVGEVTGGVSEKDDTKKNKKIYQGKEYDYVFDVDIKEGQPCLKLPYNTSEDPYMAAHNFLERNDISQNYLDQVANFIMSQVKPTNEIKSFNDSYVDPYTGGTRYTGDVVAPTKSLSENKFQYFPETKPIVFELVSADKLLSKLREFNVKVPADKNISADEFLCVEKVVRGALHGNIDELFRATFKLLTWPPELLLPALDFFRICLKHSEFNHALFSPQHSSLFNLESFACGILEDCKNDSKIILVLLKCLTNTMTHNAGSNFFLSSHNQLLEALETIPVNDSSSQQALASFILNLSISAHKTSSDKTFCINLINNVLSRITDQEAYFRLIVALGTLLQSDNVAVAIAASLDIANRVSGHQCYRSSIQKVTNVSNELLALIK